MLTSEQSVKHPFAGQNIQHPKLHCSISKSKQNSSFNKILSETKVQKPNFYQFQTKNLKA